ncbi:MAG: 7-carboxy-7-deazaguanine synthase QueE [Thermodesulfobacteriota bacterium]
MLISEIFFSLQGESTFTGLPCVFVRLAGCNLECVWCDTAYARSEDGAVDKTVEEVVEEVEKFPRGLIEISGGEPLLQEETTDLAGRLLGSFDRVLLETNGSIDISRVPEGVIRVVDVKCPSSGASGSFLLENLRALTPDDEIKFVIGDRADYEFAVEFITSNGLTRSRADKILFSPVNGTLPPKTLAQWVLSDRLCVRFQLQLHASIWPGEKGK